MAGRKVSLFVAVCLMLSGCHCQLPTVPLPTLSPQQIFDNQVAAYLLTAFNTDLNTISSSVTQITDAQYQAAIQKVENNATLLDAFNLLNTKAASARAPGTTFSCTGPFKTAGGRPTDVTQLMPGDIEYIGGLGDGVESGAGLLSNGDVSATLIEARGYTAKAGGTGSMDQGNSTIANILRDRFQNTNLQGYAVGDGECSVTDVSCSRLNVADKLAFHPNFVLQAVELIRRIIFAQNYDKLAWKMIHIFYGPNDLCSLCGDLHYKNIMAPLHIRIAVSLLYHFLSNTLVYLHVPYDLTSLAMLANNPACVALQTSLCNCIRVAPVLNPLGLPLLSNPVKANQQLIAKFLYDIYKDPSLRRKDFGVGLLRHLNQTLPPQNPDGTYQTEVLSANCLYPSRAAHYIHGPLAFNEMAVPFDQRPQSGDYTVNGNTKIDIKCPTFLQL